MKEKVKKVLLNAGWFPGRDVSEQANAWISLARERCNISAFDSAKDVLCEYGGLKICSEARGKKIASITVLIDPTEAFEDAEEIDYFAELLDTSLFPIGCGKPPLGSIFISRDGAILFFENELWKAGDTFLCAIERLAYGYGMPLLDTINKRWVFRG